MTFRVGMKVVCVDDKPENGREMLEPGPRMGGIYTVMDFRECRNGSPGLVLDINPDWQYFVWRFRPLVENKSDISFTVGAPKDSEHWDNRKVKVS